jgi:hypothetical protein
MVMCSHGSVMTLSFRYANTVSLNGEIGVPHTSALWAAVVLQARDDLDTEVYNSVDYSQAAAFFTAPGDWAISRRAIADALDLHPDDLTRLGRAVTAARSIRDGGPPVVVRPVPRLVVSVAAPIPMPVAVVPTRVPRRIPVQGGRRWQFNRFNPLLRAG